MKIHKWNDIKRSKSSPERAAKVAARIEEEELALSLQELREKVGLTQAELARAAEMAQSQVSGVERGTPRLETLRRYVEGLGGELHLTARIGGRDYELSL